MATAVSSKGKVLQFVSEGTFNTDPDAGYKDIRVEGEPTIANPTETGVPINTLMANPYDGEAPITTSQFVDDAATFTTILRTPTTPGEDPFHVTAFKAGGYQVASSDDSAVPAGAAVGSFVATTGTAVLTGEGGHVLLPSGKYFPFISADTTGGTITPGMDLPAIPSEDAAGILGADTISPGTPGPVTTTLSMRHWNQTVESGGSNYLYHLLTGCGLVKAGPLKVERGTPPTCEFSFRAAQITRGNSATFPTNSFQDEVGVQVWDDTVCGFGTSSAAGGITAAYYSVVSAELDFGVETTPVPESAGTSDTGGLCSHMSAPTDAMPTLTLVIKSDEGRMDDWETVGGASKYISLCQYGTAVTPGTGIFCPSARLIEQPTFEPYGETYEKVTLKYRLYPAGYTAGGAAIQGNQPFYIVGPSDRA